MKKLILAVMVVGLLVASCSNNGKKVKAKEAEKVESLKSVSAVIFKTVKEGSFVSWKAAHLGGINPRYGKIFIKDVELAVDKGALVAAKVLIDMASLTVESFPEGAEEIGKLTGHLKSADFFDVENHPTSEFQMVDLKPAEGAEFNSIVTGNLTIKGVTKSIIFGANVDVSDSQISIKSENFAIDRTDWNLSYNVEGTEGVPVDYIIANSINISIDVSVEK